MFLQLIINKIGIKTKVNNIKIKLKSSKPILYLILITYPYQVTEYNNEKEPYNNGIL